MAKIAVFVAHCNTRVIAWSFNNNLDKYLSSTVKVSVVKVDTDQFFRGTESERTELIATELEKGTHQTQRVLTVRDLKRIIDDRHVVADDTPVTILLANEDTDKLIHLAVTDYEDTLGRLELIVETDQIIL